MAMTGVLHPSLLRHFSLETFRSTSVQITPEVKAPKRFSITEKNVKK